MNRRIVAGVAAGLFSAALLLAVGIGAYRAGQDREIVTRTSEGEVVRVIDDGWDRNGPGPGFLIVPLVVAGVVLLVVTRRRHGYGTWHAPGAWGHGPWNQGPWNQGPWSPGASNPQDAFDEWHRRSHERTSPPSSQTHEPEA